jgi:hypothetical protein
MEGSGQDNSSKGEDGCKGRWWSRAFRLCLQRSWKWMLVALIGLLVCCYCNRGHKLRLDLPRGFCATVRTKCIKDGGVGMGGMGGFGLSVEGMWVDLEFSEEYRLECLDVDSNGVMTVRQTYKDVRLEGFELAIRTVGGHYNKLTLDEPVNEAIQETANERGPIDLSLIIRVRPNGETVDVEGAEPFVDRMLGRLIGPDDPNYLQIRNHLIEWVETKQVVGMSVVSYPEGRKIVGQIWERKVERSMPYLLGNRNISETGKIKFCKLVDGAARLEEDSEYEAETIINIWMLGDRSEKGKISIKAKGRRTGKMEIDLETGLIRSGRIVARGELTQYPRKYDLMKDFGIYWIAQTEIIEIETIFE